MAPQQPRSSPGGSRGTSPLGTRAGAQDPSLGGDTPPGVPGGCTTKGCQQPLPPGKCPLVPASPAAAATHDNKSRAVFVPRQKRFFLPVEREGSLRRSTGQGCGPISGRYLPAFALSLSPPPHQPHPSHASQLLLRWLPPVPG